MSWRTSTSAMVPQLCSMNSAIGNANDHITIAEKQVRFDTTAPGGGVIRSSALLDMASKLNDWDLGTVFTNARPRRVQRIISASVRKHQQFVCVTGRRFIALAVTADQSKASPLVM